MCIAVTRSYHSQILRINPHISWLFRGFHILKFVKKMLKYSWDHMSRQDCSKSFGNLVWLFVQVIIKWFFLTPKYKNKILCRGINCHRNKRLLPIPGEAKAKAMPGWLYIHTK